MRACLCQTQSVRPWENPNHEAETSAIACLTSPSLPTRANCFSHSSEGFCSPGLACCPLWVLGVEMGGNLLGLLTASSPSALGEETVCIHSKQPFSQSLHPLLCFWSALSPANTHGPSEGCQLLFWGHLHGTGGIDFFPSPSSACHGALPFFPSSLQFPLPLAQGNPHTQRSP